MKLVDLKMSKADKKESSPMVAGKYEGPDYPYGTCLRLDNASLEKLGMDELPKVGAVMHVSGLGRVTAVSSHESKNRDERTVEIQIEQLGVEDEDDESLGSIVRKRK